MNYDRMDSPVGTLLITATEKGIRHILFDDIADVDLPDQPNAQDVFIQQAKAQLIEYFNGQRQDFDLPLDIQGTTFRKKVWQALQTIPYGQCWSYADLAQRIGQSKAMRAVGSANGKNPLCIVIPCHRVIAKDGGLGGYTGGLERKQWLLELEKCRADLP